jgi:hypothetical protein
MMTMNDYRKAGLIWIACHCICMWFLAPGIGAQVETLPFCEDFNTGGPLDSNRWVRGGDVSGNSVPIQDINDLSMPASQFSRFVNVVSVDGDPDPVLLIGDADGNGSDYIYAEAKLPFARGNNLVCQFQSFGTYDNVGGGDYVPPTVNGADIPWVGLAFSPYGPWHCDPDGSDVNGPVGLPQTYILGGLGDGSPTNFYKFISTCLWQSGPTVESAFRDAYWASRTRTESTWIRVWLGNTDGAYGEWSNDWGATWNPFRNTAGAVIDTRDTGTNATDPAWLAFGGTPFSGHRLYDNIYVGDDSNPPPDPSVYLAGATCAGVGPPPNRVRRSELYQ